MDQKWDFTSLGQWTLVGRGDVYTVRCPIKCFAFDWIMNKEVTIDGKLFTVIGVERFAKAAPVSKGELIGLLINSMTYNRR